MHNGKTTKGIIIKLDFSKEQTVGDIKKIVGLMRAKYLIPVIDTLDLDANPRAARTGAVTDAILESIERDPASFPFKTKGILLASSQFKLLDRGRIAISPENREIEGILDGGHNTLAIGLYILQNAMSSANKAFPRGAKTWDDFKKLWDANRHSIDLYLNALKKCPEQKDLDFFVPVELLVPQDAENVGCVESFKNDLLEICAARNNNVQLQVSAKANQMGYFDDLKKLVEHQNPSIASRVEWKTNDGGDIKVQDIVALAWIPLSLITPVRDDSGRVIEPVAANKLYSGKGACLKQFEKLMSSPDVTRETSTDYRRELKNTEVFSALRLAAELPEFYDYIYKEFPKLYNAAGGSYGHITAVRTLNEKRREKCAPFTNSNIETLSPDGFIVPLGPVHISRVVI